MTSGAFLRPLIALATGALATGTLAPAALARTGNEAIDAVIATALAEQRVFLTCGATDPEGHGFLLSTWDGMVSDTLDLLEEAGFDADVRAAVASAARPEALALPPETPFGEVLEFCRAHPDWMRQLVTFRMTMLPNEIEKVLAP